MKLPLIAIATLIVVLTLIANTGVGSSLLELVELLPGKDLAGHFLLYSALGFALSLYLSGAKKHSGIWIALVAIAIVAEEFSQMFMELRTFSLADLCASLTGFAFGVCLVRVFSATSVFRQWLLGRSSG